MINTKKLAKYQKIIKEMGFKSIDPDTPKVDFVVGNTKNEPLDPLFKMSKYSCHFCQGDLYLTDIEQKDRRSVSNNNTKFICINCFDEFMQAHYSEQPKQGKNNV